ncbi:MAG: GGDEF domain-containing protein, partial [Lachnospiraceae bacterium]|nr:GGDEF domain-containing protein [Lachnospiraceae bacterium]
RIGGDEFIVVLDKTADEMEELFGRFDMICAESNERDDREQVGVSKGYAVYDKDSDSNYKVVFARADDAMYADKKAYYKDRVNEIMR